MTQAITNWLDGRIKAAVDEAAADERAAVQDMLIDMENRLTAQITSLPGLLASQISGLFDPAVLGAAVANQVGSLLSPSSIAQQVIQGIQGLLPHIPGFSEPKKEEGRRW